MAKKILIVGHCGVDGPMLEDVMGHVAKGIDAHMVNDMSTLEKEAGPDALLLVNRVLEGRFKTHSGIDLIAELAKQDKPPKMMLISDKPDAQKQAEEVGAMKGFGKAKAHAKETAELVREAIAAGGKAGTK
jgi:hypothetical protein